jgi:hypothetical protein
MAKLFFLSTVLFAILTHAQAADVTCWGDDCLKNGWTWSSASGSVDYACYRDGCNSSGWILSQSQKSYTQCKSQGCFSEGWYQINSETQNLQRDVVCGIRGPEQSCFKYGWTVYSRETGQLFTVMCHESDCLNKGWTVQFIDASIVQVGCKTGGCFTAGWREH